MKLLYKKPLLLLFILVATKALSQNTPKNDTLTFKNGSITIKALGKYKNNKEDGFWQVFYPNGTKKAEGNFENGRHIGTWKDWLINGTFLDEKVFSENPLNDTFLTIYAKIDTGV